MAPTDEVFRAVVDGIDLPVVVMRADDVVAHVNPAAESVLGRSSTTLVGRPFHDTVHRHGPDAEQLAAADCLPCQALTAAATTTGRGAWFLRSDGSVFPVAWRSWPLAAGAVALSFTAVKRTDISANAARRLADGEVEFRLQISHDLHDGAQQDLVMVLITLQLLRDARGAGDPEVAVLLDELGEHGRRAIQAVRDTVAEIHPSILMSNGLLSAVRSLADRAPVPVEVEGPLDLRFDPVAEAHAYLIVSQSLAHAIGKGEASRVWVRIEAAAGRLALHVTRDGPRPELPDERDEVARIADRVAALDGTFTAVAGPGAGTTLSAVFALPEPPT